MNRKNIFGKALFVLGFLSFIYFVFLVQLNKLLPIRYRMIFVGLFLLIYLILAFISFKREAATFSRFTAGFLSLVLLLVFGAGSYYLSGGMSALDKLSKEREEVITYSMVVLKESGISYWDELFEESIGASLSRDTEDLALYLGHVEKESGRSFSTYDIGSYLDGARDLLEGDIRVLLLNESFRSLIDDEMEFSELTRVIEPEDKSLTEIRVEREVVKKDAGKNESFNLYISGIDTYGQISTVSRSDVNLIMSVNPDKNEIMITTIPRDSYLPLAGGGNDGYDKLTHAGIYGISSSVETLENFLDIDINYYARVNFSSLIDIVDVLGGIEVDNPVDFGGGGYYFPAGKIHLSGEEALRFSRERYNLAGGDFDRGMNQTRVLTAMIEKSLSPAILRNYNSFLSVALESAETSIPKDKMIELVNGELDKPGKWTINSQQVKGSGQMGLPSYAMPGWNLYMFVPSDESVNEVKSEIKRVLN